LVARWIAGSPRPKVVATRRVIYRVRSGGSWSRADRLIAVSKAVRDVLVDCGIPGDRVSVVYSAVDPEQVRAAGQRPLDVRQRLNLHRDTPLAVNAAALERPKDQATLLRAAAAARARAPNLHWVIAGEGRRRRELETQARALGVTDIVHFLGYLPEVEPLIREGDVLVMSSKEEGLGGAVLQALALGKPVVATGAGGLVEIVPASGLVPVGDADALASRVLEALKEPGRPTLPPQFAAPETANGALAVYRSLV
jgi:glycosyltransferase involved in cell wall biosynthesis